MRALEGLEPTFEYLFTNYPAFLVVGLGTFVLHELLYWAIYIPYLIIERMPSFQKYKIQPDKPNTFELRWHAFKALIQVHVTGNLPLMLVAHHFLSLLGIGELPPFPTWTEVFSQILFFYFIEDFYFYWIHRLLHYGPFYKYVHKVHHEHAAPFGMVAEYAHPIENLFLGIGTTLGPIICRSHLLTIWIWLIFRLWQTIDVHSGFDFPWSLNHWIPFWGGADFHDYHHMAFVGNYSSTFRYWDWLFGTDLKYKAWKKKMQVEGNNNNNNNNKSADAKSAEANSKVE